MNKRTVGTIGCSLVNIFSVEWSSQESRGFSCERFNESEIKTSSKDNISVLIPKA